MSSIEKKIIGIILHAIRARGAKPASVEAPPGSGSGSPARIREAQFSDFEAVRALKRRWGLIPDSFENWERIWRSNPALQGREQPLPLGWVLESEGRVVGYLGNIASQYRFRGRTLTAVTGHGLVVEPEHRALSITLNAAFYRQQFVDLYLSTTAIEIVGKIARIFKADKLPQPDYEVLFWVLRPGAFARGLMEKLRPTPALSAAGRVLASSAIAADSFLRFRRPRRRRSSLTVREISVGEIGIEFEALWSAKLSEGNRLLAVRDPSTLRWHFGTPGDEGVTQVYCVYSASPAARLLGYVVVRTDPPNTCGLRKTTVADLFALNDDPAVLAELIVAAHDHAQLAGSHVLEVLGFPPAVRQVCARWNPYTRKYPSCPFFYRAADPELHRTMADSSVWYASPFDGDTTLMPILAMQESPSLLDDGKHARLQAQH
jgi:hypothetical protein